MIEPRAPIKTGRRRPGRGGPWLIVIVAVVGLALIAAGLRFVPGSPFASARASGTRGTGAAGSGGQSAETTPSPTLAPLPFRSAPVTVTLRPNEFMSWALLDRRTGQIVGSSNMAAASQTTASMIKAWLAADYLRRADENGRTPSDSQLHTVEIMIRDSDNNAAITIYNANGKTASIQRLIRMCGLTDSRATPGEWSRTYISARDTVRYGDCIADGRAAGEKWTPWLLDMMRKVRGEGDFGPRKALPPAVATTVAIKNGWLVRDETKPLIWHVSCMAIGDTWVLAVLQRYLPTSGYTPDLVHIGNTAADIARQLLNPQAG